MAGQLLDLEEFRSAARAGRSPDAVLHKFATTDPEVIGGMASRVRRFCFSDGGTDHSNDQIRQSGWDLGVFRANPVCLWAHDASTPPIGRASNVAVQGDRLMGDIEFASAAVSPFADEVFRLIQGGFVKAVSVGFKPVEWSLTSDKARPYGIDFKRQVLVEISVVPVPANARALIAARAAGLSTAGLRDWAERVLDGESHTAVPRAELERIHRQAGSPPPSGGADKSRPSRAAETPAERLAEVAAMRRSWRRQEEAASIARSVPSDTAGERVRKARQARQEVDRLIGRRSEDNT